MNRSASLFIACGAAAAASFLAGCHKNSHDAPPEPQLPTAAVRAEIIQTSKRPATEEVVGTVRPKLSAAIAANVSGTIERMNVALGQTVRAGDLLVQIDAREIQARLDQASAVREQAQKDIDRFKALLDQSAVTQQEFDAAQSRLRVAEATVAEAETMLGYTKIAAPFDGIVTVKRADVGDLATSGRSLLELEDPTSRRLEADMPEGLMNRIQLGDQLGIRVPAASVSITGTVTEIAPGADPISRTSRVKLDLPTTQGLRSGQFGRVAVPLAEVSALRVPAAAVVVRGQMEIVFVVANEHAQLRLVKTGKHLADEVEILSGLTAGETVVVEGAGRLRDGQPVEVSAPSNSGQRGDSK